MRRFAVCGFVALAVGLVLAPGALASTGVRHAVPLGTRHAAMTRPDAAPLATGPYAITGHVLDFAGNLVNGAEVGWGWWDGSAFNFGGTNWVASAASPGTGTDGKFTFPGVSSQPGNNDYLDVYYPSGPLEEMDSWSLDFSAKNDATASPNTYEMQPAEVNVATVNAPSPDVEVRVGEQNTGYAQSFVQLTSGAGVAGVVPSSFDDVVAYGYNAIGAVTAQTEWLGTPVSATAGVLAGTVNLDWANAQYAYLAGPTCQHSGKPGTTVKMTLRGWPTSEKAEFVAAYGANSTYDYSASVTSAGMGGIYTVPLAVRAAAPVGIYEINTYRVDSPDSLIGMWDYYQVCTFKSTASAIRHGHAIRLSGVLPAAAGRATLYSTTHKVTAQPATLAAKGWTKMGTYKVASRKFATGLLHPKRTTWYVVKYSGYAFPAFTSVIKVTVH